MRHCSTKRQKCETTCITYTYVKKQPNTTKGKTFTSNAFQIKFTTFKCLNTFTGAKNKTKKPIKTVIKEKLWH